MQEQNAATQPYCLSSSGLSQVTSFDLHTYPPPREQGTLKNQNTLAGLGPSEPYGAPPRHNFAGEGEAWGSQPEPPQHFGTPWSPQCGTVDSYGSSDIDLSRPGTICLDSIDPALLQGGSQSQPCLTSMLIVTSPDQLNTANSSPALYDYQSGSPAQATGHAIVQVDNYFDPRHNYLQYTARREQQPVSSPQGQKPYPSSNIGDFESPSPYQLESSPSYQRMHLNGSRDVITDHPSLPPYKCDDCGTEFGRETDLKRHMETTRKHNVPKGPACREPGCGHLANFTRVDNFREHLRKQHQKTTAEADAFIGEWRARGR